MAIEIPISVSHKDRQHLIYFDADRIEQPERLKSAYLVIDEDISFQGNDIIPASVNDCFSSEEVARVKKQRPSIRGINNGYHVLADVSEAVKMIAGNFTKNKGLVVKNVKYLHNPGLIITFIPSVIHPNRDCVFYEKVLEFTSYAYRLVTPWFYSGISQTITFSIYNTSDEDILLHLENSPDAEVISDDAQKLKVEPGKTVTLVPYKFSKYIRLVMRSGCQKVACKVWFQTQLLH